MSPRPGNRLLAGLPREEFERLRPELLTVNIRPREVVHHAGDAIDYVYFPNSGVFSLTSPLPDGALVEALTVGDEGMVGLEALFASDAVAGSQNLVQVPDASAERLGITAFRRELERHGALHAAVARYAQVGIAVIMLGAACNARHGVQQRCAKWLLMTHDRVHRHREFRLSHEFLAITLGTTRPTVTLVASALQRAGMIAYKHGRVSVLDRRALERAACACYPLIRTQFARLA